MQLSEDSLERALEMLGKALEQRGFEFEIVAVVLKALGVDDAEARF